MQSRNIVCLQLPTTLKIDHFAALPHKIELMRQLSHDNKSKGIEIEGKKIQSGSEGRWLDVMIRSKLESYVPEESKCYPSSFVSFFLLIKINSLASSYCRVSFSFLQGLIQLYNSHSVCSIRISKSDRQFFSQIALLNGYPIDGYDIQNILDGGCLVSATLLHVIHATTHFLKKVEISAILSITALQGRADPFIDIVHQQKNHHGQIKFAKILNQAIHLHPNIKITNNSMVQDAYSMRCTPQVYGVIYDCLAQLEAITGQSLNKMHFKYFEINGQKIKNLGLRSEVEILQLDMLICALNEIGSMAFMRSERMLNSYLGKNDFRKSNPVDYNLLVGWIERVSYSVPQNRLIASPSNADTTNHHNFEEDIYHNDGANYSKFAGMMSGLSEIILLEIVSSIEIIQIIYGNQTKIFVNEKMNEAYIQFVRMRSNTLKESIDVLRRWVEK